jgi:diacylglycerol kinase
MKRRIAAVRDALRGGWAMLRSEPHARFHAVATLAVLAAGGWCRLAAAEWLLVVLAIAMVWSAEAMNTAIEHLADEVTRERREGIGRAKDVAAFGVLVAALGAATIGAVVFGPRILGAVAALPG